MKIFIGQAVTGHDRDKLKKECEMIIEILKSKEHEPILVIDYPPEIQNLPKRVRLGKHCFGHVDNCELFLAIVRNENKSEGMLFELGHILDTDKKIILFIKKEVKNTYLREISDSFVDFKDSEDMLNKLKDFDFDI